MILHQVPTSKHGGKITPTLLVWHYTVCSAKDAIRVFSDSSNVQASAHFVLDRQGEITQMVPIDVKAWHAGRSEWRGQKGVNGFSIGVELENIGPISRDGKDVYGRPYPGETVEINGRRWATYTQEQVQAATELTRWIESQYPGIEHVFHSEIAPGRKIDPGPAWPVEMFTRIVVEAPGGLNLRDAPNGQVIRVLPNGSPVELIGGVGNWVRIKGGFVWKSYLKRVSLAP